MTEIVLEQPRAEPLDIPQIITAFDTSDPVGLLEKKDLLPTEDDLPYDDGEPMETPRHRDQMNLLIDSLKGYWGDRKKYYVGGNMFLHFVNASGDKTFRGPDFFLVMEVDDRERKSWVVWQEGMRYPDVIIELLSDSTRRTDKREKKDLYEQVFRTSEYYLYDPYSQEFLGYRMEGNRYKPVLPDKKAKIYSPMTGLYLAIKEDWLRWMTPDRYVLPTDKERADEAETRAEEERMKAEEERMKTQEERMKAQKERMKVQEEQQRAERLAQKLRDLGVSPEDFET